MTKVVIVHVDDWHCDEVHDRASWFDDSLGVCQEADCRVTVYQPGDADGANARDLEPEGKGFKWERTLWGEP